MLVHVEHWKSYPPTSSFKSSDALGFKGEKTFEQPVIARDSGSESLPALNFSWFDPATRRYETAQTAPLRVAVTAAPTGAPALAQNTPSAPGRVSPATGAVTPAMQDGLRPDHVATGAGPASLVPLSQRPAFIAIPSLMMLAFCSAFFWVGRRRDDDGPDTDGPTTLQAYQSLLSEAAQSNDPELFFRAGRAALQQALGSSWHVPPDAVTLEAVETRLGAQGTAAQVFRLADEASYSNEALQPCDFHRWHSLIERQLTEAVS